MDHLYDKYVGKLKHEAVKLKREAKRIAELETPLEKNLREATSNQNWGCPNSVLYELAVACQSYSDRQKIMKKVWERLQSSEDKWRRVLKTLMLLDTILKHGPEQVALEVQSEQAHLRRLVNFQCVEEGHDRGGGIRERAQALLALLGDRDLLATERRKAKEHQAKLSGAALGTCEGHGGGSAAIAGSGGSSAGGISRAKFEEKFNELKQKRDKERAERGGDPLNELNNSEGSDSGRRRRSAASRTQGSAPRVAAPGAAAQRDETPPGRAPAKSSDSSDEEAERPRNAVPLADLLDMCDGPAPAAAAAVRHALPVPAPVAAPVRSSGLGDLLGESAPASSSAAEVDLFGDAAFQSAGAAGERTTGNSVPLSAPGSGPALPWAAAQAAGPQEDLFGSLQQAPPRPAQPVPVAFPAQGFAAPVTAGGAVPASVGAAPPVGARQAVPVPTAPVRSAGAGEEDPVRRNLRELDLGSGQDTATGKGAVAPGPATLDLGDPFALALGGHR